MMRVPLPTAPSLQYIRANLFDREGEFSVVGQNVEFDNCRTFVASRDVTSSSRLLEFEEGGVSNAFLSDSDVADDICSANILSPTLMYYDPWSEMSDLGLVNFSSRVTTLEVFGSMLHVAQISRPSKLQIFNIIGEFRTNSIGFLKIILLSGFSFERVVDALKGNPQGLFDFCKTMYVNCYDDESWLAVDIVRSRFK